MRVIGNASLLCQDGKYITRKVLYSTRFGGYFFRGANGTLREVILDNHLGCMRYTGREAPFRMVV